MRREGQNLSDRPLSAIPAGRRRLNWDEGPMIDLPSSFNGSTIEVEPDVVLVVYPESMDEIRPSYVRAQLIRITPQGPERLLV